MNIDAVKKTPFNEEVNESTFNNTHSSKPVSRNNSDLSLRVMLAVLDWLYTQQDAQTSMEKEQEAKKTQHWKYVEERHSKMNESTTAPFVASCAASILAAAGAGLGFSVSNLVPGDPLIAKFSALSGALQSASQLPDKYYEGIKNQRDADAYLIEQKAQKAEKSSQGQSSKVQKSERIEDSAQSFWKQMSQVSSQLSDAVNSMIRSH